MDIIHSRNLNVSNFKRTFKLLLEKIEKLKDIEQHLTQNLNTITNEEWSEKIKTVDLLKTEIVCLKDTVASKETLQSLKSLIQKRRRRRKSWKIKRIKYKKSKQEEHKITEKVNIHQEINPDDCGNMENDKNSLKRTKTRILEIRNHLRAIGKVKSIHQLNDEKSLNELQTLQEQWQEKLKEHQNTKEKLIAKIKRKSKSVLEQWKEIFFGTTDKILYGEPKTFPDFIRVRSIWDSYIVPEESNFGSFIPSGWILPHLENENDSSEWKKYLQTD